MLEEKLQDFSPGTIWLGVMEAEMTCTPPGALSCIRYAFDLLAAFFRELGWLLSV